MFQLVAFTANIYIYTLSKIYIIFYINNSFDYLTQLKLNQNKVICSGEAMRIIKEKIIHQQSLKYIIIPTYICRINKVNKKKKEKELTN